MKTQILIKCRLCIKLFLNITHRHFITNSFLLQSFMYVFLVVILHELQMFTKKQSESDEIIKCTFNIYKNIKMFHPFRRQEQKEMFFFCFFLTKYIFVYKHYCTSKYCSLKRTMLPKQVNIVRMTVNPRGGTARAAHIPCTISAHSLNVYMLFFLAPSPSHPLCSPSFPFLFPSPPFTFPFFPDPCILKTNLEWHR